MVDLEPQKVKLTPMIILPRAGKAHIEAATPVIMAGLWIAGIVGFACVLGGIFAIYWNALSPSEVGLLGNKLTTGHVGVAFVFVGVGRFGSCNPQGVQDSCSIRRNSKLNQYRSAVVHLNC
jgi:hypothetical protein